MDVGPAVHKKLCRKMKIVEKSARRPYFRPANNAKFAVILFLNTAGQH
jgi:hypothetical protein